MTEQLLQKNKIAKITIPKFVTGMLNQKLSVAELYSYKKLLWKGYSGQVAIIELDTPIADIEIVIKKAYTGHPFPFFRDFSIIGTVEQGKKYEIKDIKERTQIYFADPTKINWIISKIDEKNSYFI